MFAEDVDLLPKASFSGLIASLRDNHRAFKTIVEELWKTMDKGGMSVALRAKLLRFNGGFFGERRALSVTPEQIDLLAAAARADWRDVEPAIFGTLLERALDTRERHRLGAHYTPRAYVERLVIPTVIEPLRQTFNRRVLEAHLGAGRDGSPSRPPVSSPVPAARTCGRLGEASLPRFSRPSNAPFTIRDSSPSCASSTSNSTPPLPPPTAGLKKCVSARVHSF